VPHILIIEDDPKLGPMLKSSLEYAGYNVTLAVDGKFGMGEALRGAAQLIVLDLMLPKMGGMQILKALRRELIHTPVIILTALGTEAERLEGFRVGCDDYIVKPFSLMELIARIRAVLRRSGWRNTPSVIHCDGLTIDPDSRSATLSGLPLDLAPKEFELLYTLASHPNQALSRRFLLDEVWGEETDVTNRVVDTRILSLRRKIEPTPDTLQRIVTVYKVGYMWKINKQS